MDIKEAITPPSEIMLSFTALTGTEWRLWKWTAHLEYQVCFFKKLNQFEALQSKDYRKDNNVRKT